MSCKLFYQLGDKDEFVIPARIILQYNKFKIIANREKKNTYKEK